MQTFAALVALVPLVAAHGQIKSPPHRTPGDAYKTACGEQPFYQQSSDVNGNVQGIMQVVGKDLNAESCNLWLCKGFTLEDNKDNVQTYSLGEKIDFDINIAAPHTGYANVSVVKTSSNSIIGEPLIEFDDYASNSGMPANNSAFSVTLPESLDGCTEAGDCVLQWFWDAPDIDQTYEGCVDFTIGAGSGSGSGSAKPSTPAAAATTAAAASTQAAEAPAASTPAAAATTQAAEADDEEECPADEEDEEPAAEEDDEECPADEEEEPAEDDEEECPADEE